MAKKRWIPQIGEAYYCVGIDPEEMVGAEGEYLTVRKETRYPSEDDEEFTYNCFASQTAAEIACQNIIEAIDKELS